MSQVTIALREQGLLKMGACHKSMLNALLDPAIYQPSAPYLLEPFLLPHHAPITPSDDGLVVIDRDRQWVGSAQHFTHLTQIFPFLDKDAWKSLPGFDLEKNLAALPLKNWPQAMTLDAVRLCLLQRAFDAGYVRRVGVGRWNDDPEWQDRMSLGLDTLQECIGWLEAQRFQLTDGEIFNMTYRYSLEFSPPGWTMEEFDPSTNILDMASKLADHGFVPSMEPAQVLTWWEAGTKERIDISAPPSHN